LMNALSGMKVSIVTHKVQTTRARIRGIAMEGQSQIVFVDTPGLFKTRRKLDKAMVAAAWTGAGDADVVVLMIEAHRGITDGVRMILEGLEQRATKSQRIVLAINKIDRVKSERLLELTQKMVDLFEFEEVFMISAEKGHGVSTMLEWLSDNMPAGPYLYPEDQVADVPMRMIAAEVTREKLMLRLHQELPYNLTVETENWDERKDGSVRIDQMIYVSRSGHKGIVLGPKGETIKAISMTARQELAEMLERPVHLFLQVKLRPNWENEAERYDQMGLNFKDTK